MRDIKEKVISEKKKRRKRHFIIYTKTSEEWDKTRQNFPDDDFQAKNIWMLRILIFFSKC